MCLALIAITALAALFVPQYLSVFWTPLATRPWDVVGGLVVIGVVAAVNVRGLVPSAGGFRVPRDRQPDHAGRCW